MNNRTELKTSIGSTLDFKNTFQYDQLQRLTDILQQGQSGGNAVLAKHVTFAYNALSQRTQIARYQSTGTTSAVATTDFSYDSANRLSGIAHKQGSTNLNTYAYTYDPLSRIASIVSTLEGTDTYSYDQTSQLVGATHTSQSNETYGFDANGNQNTTGFTTGTNNQTTAGLGFTYTFDDEGNRTSKTETATGKVEEYTWDYRNRLTKVVFRNSSGGAIVKQVDYEYDPYNRLVHRTFDADGAGSGAATDQFWVYDEGINAVLQFDGSSASNLSHRYLWSNNVDELLADEQIAGSNTLWGLADHLGSLRDIADLNEGTGITSITNHRTFNSFGKLISETNAVVDMLFAFTGKQFDEATLLQHNLFRWYDPALGQWLSEDPLSFAAGDENVRRYVGNHCIHSLDNIGLTEQPPNSGGNASNSRYLSQIEQSVRASKLSYLGFAIEDVNRTYFGYWLGYPPPRAGFDCDDYALAMNNYVLNQIINEHPAATGTYLAVYWERQNGNKREMDSHYMNIFSIEGHRYLVDAQSGQVAEISKSDEEVRNTVKIFLEIYKTNPKEKFSKITYTFDDHWKEPSPPFTSSPEIIVTLQLHLEAHGVKEISPYLKPPSK